MSRIPPEGASSDPERTPAQAPDADVAALDTDDANVSRTGVLATFAQRPVTANVMMLVLLVGGLVIGSRTKQEVFPEFDLDSIVVDVPYPGAGPAEVEQGVILAVEEAVRGLDGVDDVRSLAPENGGSVTVDLVVGTDPTDALADVKAAVDRIASFPEEAERPTVTLTTNRQQVLDLVVYGDKTERELRTFAERTRDELLLDDRITQVELSAVRPYEISIEVSQENLRRYGLTLDAVADAVRQSTVELPGGAVRTRGGDVLVRVSARRLRGSEFEDIVVLSDLDGTVVRIRDLGRVNDAFAETDHEARFDGKRAALLRIYRVGDQTPIEVSDAARGFVARNRDRLPAGVHFAIWNDASEVYRDRVDLLMRNAWMGLFLVLLVLGLFLEARLAFWVTLGIPTSFIGALLFMPGLDVSINMLSLFAFIVTLGMVVDDAIVVGDAVHRRRQDGMRPLDAVIAGTRDVAVPVVISALTTCAAFAPLLFVAGTMGKFFRVIPVIVITVLLISLLESLFVLPAHLAHESKGLRLATHVVFLHKLDGAVRHTQRAVAWLLEWVVARAYVPTARWAVRHRYVTGAICIAILTGTTGLVAGGHVGFTFFPRIESDIVTAHITLPYGASIDETRRAEERVETALEEIIASHGGRRIIRGVFTELGAGASHLCDVSVYMVPADQRPVTASTFANAWRRATGEIPGVERLVFDYATGPSSGAPINVELAHADLETLEAAAAELAADLSTFAGVIDIDDGFTPGKPQLDVRLTPEGRAAGLTEIDVARQLRAAFFGVEAVREQRGRDEVRVYVRLTENERRSLSSIDRFLVRTPSGGEMPLAQAASVAEGHAYTGIRRTNGRRVVNVTADVGRESMAAEVQAALMNELLPRIERNTPGLRFDAGGQQHERDESMESLFAGFKVALFVMYGLIAIAFRRYVQPLVVMSAIPFGIIGAVLGHVVMGYDLSLVSLLGVVALSGVAVNDSLVLVDAANRFRKGVPIERAVVLAGARRFRPILLTSLTTFFGLAPMIAETSVQARFLVPMAVSLGFGVLFATFITLLLVPALYVILDDVVVLFGRLETFIWPDASAEEDAPDPPVAASPCARPEGASSPPHAGE